MYDTQGFAIYLLIRPTSTCHIMQVMSNVLPKTFNVKIGKEKKKKTTSRLEIRSRGSDMQIFLLSMGLVK